METHEFIIRSFLGSAFIWVAAINSVSQLRNLFFPQLNPFNPIFAAVFFVVGAIIIQPVMSEVMLCKIGSR